MYTSHKNVGKNVFQHLGKSPNLLLIFSKSFASPSAIHILGPIGGGGGWVVVAGFEYPVSN